MVRIMRNIEILKKCEDRKTFALILGYTEKKFTGILYSKDIKDKYYSFKIPKKTGGQRHILAPYPQLKLLQSRLAILLSNCYEEIELNRIKKLSHPPSILSFSSYGFTRSLSCGNPLNEYHFDIYSNAKNHVNKKYVLNIDIEDFFGSITFSRIVGYFTKNINFSLDTEIALLIAQVATYRPSENTEGYLPQGSPLSPIISNLIGGILDLKLLRLAHKYKLDYSRYADDITFSTNMMEFPKEIAYSVHGKWAIGSKLKKAVESSRFNINHSKTRLYTRNNRQEVTSLTVNKKVNISSKYYRYTRSMVNQYCRTGTYSKSSEHRNHEINSARALNGILSYIYYVKRDRNTSINDDTFREFKKLSSIEKLYVKFLFHYNFVYPEKMLVIGEGVTDPLHLKYACRKLSKINRTYIRFSYLGDMTRFSEFMRFGGGTGHLHKFLTSYNVLYKSKLLSLKPCIILVDGDKAGRDVIKHAVKLFNSNKLVFKGIKDVEAYHLSENLYIVQLKKDKEIEDLYHPRLKDSKIGRRIFNPTNKSNDLKLETEYGKKEFFENIILESESPIDFSGFEMVFNTFYNIQVYHLIYWLSAKDKSENSHA